MDVLLPVLSGLLQLAAFAVLVGELVVAQRLVGWYAAGLARWSIDASGLPRVTDPERLVGMEGRTRAVRWRWDAERRALLFVRPLFSPVSGHRGVPTGSVRFGPDGAATVRWVGTPLTLWPLAFGLLCLGAGYFVVVEGEWAGLALVPFGAVALTVIAALSQWTARHTLTGLVLPELVEAIAEHTAEGG